MPKETSISKIESIRHSLAHLLAAAVLKKFPKAKLGIGPVIENGFYYDFLLDADRRGSRRGSARITPEDLAEFEKTMRELIARHLPFVAKKATSAEAKKLFKDQPFKLDLIKEFSKDKKPLSIYHAYSDKRQATSDKGFTIGSLAPCPMSHVACFFDLCRGGHVKNTKEINPDAFMLDRLAGAYWRGDEKNPQLQRIYGVAFETKKELDDFLKMREEAERRDHRKLGERLDLFTFSELVGPGLPIWTTKGTIVRDELEKFAKETELKWGYERIVTPHIAKEKLFEISGHLPYYKEDMYPGMKLDDATYYLKAMNCPITMALFAQKPHSYRELPMRLAEYGAVYRYEFSGVLSGLLRVRGFTQNDAHIFCSEDQVEDEFVQVMKLHEYYYRDVFQIKDYYVRLSLRDKKKKSRFGGSEAIWEKAEGAIRRAIKRSGVPFKEAVGEATFYGPKADFQIKSVVGREETASTNQVDFIMPARFGLKYIGKDGKEHPVVVIHRAPLGSHERFIGFLIEHFAGALPLWLSPVQAAILPVSDKFNSYAGKVLKTLKENGIRAETDDNNESLGKKIRNAELQKIPYVLVVGEKEEKNETVNVRQRGSASATSFVSAKGGSASGGKTSEDKQEGEMPLLKLTEKLTSEIREKTI